MPSDQHEWDCVYAIASDRKCVVSLRVCVLEMLNLHLLTSIRERARVLQGFRAAVSATVLAICTFGHCSILTIFGAQSTFETLNCGHGRLNAPMIAFSWLRIALRCSKICEFSTCQALGL